MNPLIDTSEWNEDELKLFCTYLAGGGYYLLRQWLLDSPLKTPEEMTDMLFHFIDKLSSLTSS